MTTAPNYLDASDEKQLFLFVNNKDNEALSALFNNYGNSAYFLDLKYMSNQADVDLQKFLELAKDVKKYSPPFGKMMDSPVPKIKKGEVSVYWGHKEN